MKVSDSHTRKLMKVLKELGFTFRDGTSHIVVYSPRGKRVCTLTPKKYHFDMYMSQMRREGIDIEPIRALMRA